MKTLTASKANRPLFDQVVLRASDLFSVRRSALNQPDFTPFTTFARVSQSTAVAAAIKALGHIDLDAGWTSFTVEGPFLWREHEVWVYSESIGWLAKRWVYDGDNKISQLLSCTPDRAPLVFPDADSAMLFVQAAYAVPFRLGAVDWKWDEIEDRAEPAALRAAP